MFPETFNSALGSQVTSEVLTSGLKAAQIRINMDDKRGVLAETLSLSNSSELTS